MSMRSSHSELMVTKAIRAEIGLLRDDWFLPVQRAAQEKALEYVNRPHELPWREASAKALQETYAEYRIEGIAALVGNQALLETGAATA